MASITLARAGQGEALPCVVLWKRPDLWSVELGAGGGNSVRFLSDGRRQVELRGGKVLREGVHAEELGVDRLLRCLFLLEFFRDGAGEEAAIEETVRRDDGGYNLRIGKVDAAGRKWLLSLDAKSLEPNAVREWNLLEDGKVVPVETFLEERTRDARGHLVPRRLSTYLRGNLVQEIRIRDLRWNRGLKEVDFRIP